jgi:hypothetical protein
MIAHMCTHAREKIHTCTCDCVHYSPHVPSFLWKKIRNQELIPYELVNCRMYIHWREREHDDFDTMVLDDPDVVATLAECVLFNFF